MKPDGSTSGGCWIYTGVYADGVNQSARRKPGREQNWVAPEWGWAWPANRRILYNRASADPDGRPWSERKALRLVGRGAAEVDGARRARLRGRQGAVLPPGRRGRRRSRGPRRRRPVHHAGRRQGLAVRAQRAARRAAADALRAAGVAGQQPALPPAGQPDPQGLRAQGQPVEPVGRRAGRGRLPVRLHDLPADRAPHRGWHEPVAALPVRAAAGVLLRGLARAGAGARPGEQRLGDDRHGPDRRSRPGCWSPSGWRR